MKKLKRILYLIGVVLTLVFLFATPIFAIPVTNPTSITFGITAPYNKYAVYQNVIENGDLLFAALPYIHYAGGDPTTYTSRQAFSFQILNSAGTTVLYQTPIVNYEDTVIGIYLTAAQVTAGGSDLTYGGANKLRLAPNPTLLTPTEVDSNGQNGNQQTVTLFLGDWNTGTLGYTKVTSASNSLRLQMLSFALDLYNLDLPTGGYTVFVSGVTYLNTVATQIFINGISGLDAMCPTLFQVSSSGIALNPGQYSYSTGTVSGTSGTNTLTGVGTSWLTAITANGQTAVAQWIMITGDSNKYQISSVTTDTTIVLDSNLNTSPSGATYVIILSQSYSEGLTPQSQLGTTIHNGIKSLGDWLNIGELGGGIVVMIGISMSLVGVVYTKFHSAIAAEAMVSVVLLIGIYFGILPMPIGIIIISLLTLIALIMFITRGIM